MSQVLKQAMRDAGIPLTEGPDLLVSEYQAARDFLHFRGYNFGENFHMYDAAVGAEAPVVVGETEEARQAREAEEARVAQEAADTAAAEEAEAKAKKEAQDKADAEAAELAALEAAAKAAREAEEAEAARKAAADADKGE